MYVRNVFTHSLRTFLASDAHGAITMERTRRIEDDTRTSPEIEDGQLYNKRMKDKITVTGDDLHISTRVDGIGGEQHGRRRLGRTSSFTISTN